MPTVTDQMLADQQQDIHDTLARITEQVQRLRASHDALRDVVKRGLSLKGGWREAIVELEDWCHERVRLKNMLAAADQLDDWADTARQAIAAASEFTD